jgi:DNA-binding MarR family transcriptional regulator
MSANDANVVHSLGLASYQLAQKLARLQTEFLENRLALTYTQYRVLARIRDGFTSITALSKNATISLPTLSNHATTLADRGFLTRTAVRGQRAVTLTVTAAGERAILDAEQYLDELSERIFGHLAPDGQRLLLEQVCELIPVVEEYMGVQRRGPR